MILGLVDETFAVELEDVEAAKEILFDVPQLSARDTLHVAVMRRHDVTSIMSFDRGFDRCAGVTRLG